MLDGAAGLDHHLRVDCRLGSSATPRAREAVQLSSSSLYFLDLYYIVIEIYSRLVFRYECYHLTIDYAAQPAAAPPAARTSRRETDAETPWQRWRHGTRARANRTASRAEATPQ